ncbi:MAG: hypothetical protein Q4F00_09145 [bacterium]|nr:hypothetical protein [bacterium]
MFFRSQQSHDIEHAKQNISEENSLGSAWQLMQKDSWDKALEILYQHTRPFERPLEFMVYRNVSLLLFGLICFIMPLFVSSNNDIILYISLFGGFGFFASIIIIMVLYLSANIRQARRQK